MGLSIIVPVYNAEKFIERCINSLFIQGLNTANFEIIAVNDGSKDNSLDILKSYANQHKNIKVLNSVNLGAGAARNIGIKHAAYDALMFVDADDYIESNVLLDLLRIFETTNLDILGFETVSKRGDKTIITQSLLTEYDQVFNGECFLLRYKDGFGPCAKLIKKDLFIDNNLYFPEGVIPEDIELIPKLFLAADKIMYVNLPAYYYVFNEDSVTKKKSKESYIKRIQGLLYVINSLNTFTVEYMNVNPDVYRYLNQNIISKCVKELFYFIDIRAPFDFDQLKKIHSQLRKNKILPLRLIGIRDFYVFNFYSLHLISYCLQFPKLIYFSNKVIRKLENLIKS